MSSRPVEEVAIVGMAARFPGAPDVETFWKNLRAGVDSIRRLSDEELLAAGESKDRLLDPAYVKACPALDGAELFDAAFFNVSASDAALMDPQHRVFLETAWAALEDAGYDPSRTGGAVGVFAACGMSAYMMYHLVPNRRVMDTVGEWLVRHTANDMNFLATRVSYELNLTGPSMNVQTACSSSLVAVHLAAQSLLSGECDVALAGASTVLLPLGRGYVYKEGEILSPDGTCRPFDARSAGTVFGSGTGAVVLKRLSDALAARDRVLAVLKGSAVNNDGAGKAGYLAPGVEGQAAVVSEALAVAGVPADSISYVETHGTGTLVGDPIEVAALTQAFRAQTSRRGFCAIGSVKSNLGHLGEAAGIASLMKTVLALEAGELPPSLHFESPNPRIDFESSPFVVKTALTPWTSRGPRRAGVTALGAGGTNAHLVLEEAPPAEPSRARRARHVVTLSAKTDAALGAAARNLAAHLGAHPEVPLADAAHTLQVGRKAFARRRALVASSTEDAAAALGGEDPARLVDGTAESEPSVVFMFPGGGAQHAGMARELAETEPVFAGEIERCLEALPSALSARVKDVLFGEDVEAEKPSAALPALFAVEWALARTLAAWGVKPAACIGHSMGEYVAAALAGVMTLRDALLVVAERGRLFETLPPGGMLAVPLSASELAPLLTPGLSIAADNGPALSVASGPRPELDELERALVSRGAEATRVHIDVAAHSAMVEPILRPFEDVCRRVALATPSIPWVSNLTGAFIRTEEATDPAYWARHLRGTVRFREGLAALLAEPRVLVEIGPGRTLSQLARSAGTGIKAIPAMRHPKEPGSDQETLLLALARLWTAGAPIDWAAFHEGEALNRVALPTYPFERVRHFIEAPAPGAWESGQRTIAKKRDVASWFSVPGWKTAPSPRARAEDRAAERWLVFLDETGLASRLVHRLRVAGGGPTEIHTVSPGERYRDSSDPTRGTRHFTIDPTAPGDHKKLLAALGLPGRGIDRIVHAWNVTPPGRLRGHWTAHEPWAWRSLLSLAQALGSVEAPPFTLVVLSNQLHRIGADEDLVPEKSALLGPCRVIPREIPGATVRSVDVAVGASGSWQDSRLVDQLLSELAWGTEPIVAWRGPDRFVEALEPVPLENAGALPVRDGGVYLVTGAFGGLGALVATHLARRARVRLVLVARGAFPDRALWDGWAARNGEDEVFRRIEAVRALEEAGAEVLVANADVTSRSEMNAALARAKARFGRIDGAVHTAGVLDDALLQLKTSEAAAAVLAPKITGTLVLEELLRHERLDFFVLFSSVSARLGPPGQIDYAAANAFLDAFAEWKTAHDGTPAVSIAWGPWRRTGMAARLASEAAGAAPSRPAPRSQGTHPFLPPVALETPEEARFEIPLARGADWLVDDHVVLGGEAVVPGTGYLELARAAFEAASHRPEGAMLELSDVVFHAPFLVPRGEERTLSLRIDKKTGTFSFTRGPKTHAAGRARWVPAHAPRVEAVGRIAARCRRPGRVKDGFLDQAFLAFGRRWKNVKSVATGAGEALARLELDAPFDADCAALALHPALLDMATGCAQHVSQAFDAARDFYVPLSYGRLTLSRALPPRLLSHVRLREGSAGVLVFDVTLLDEHGDVLAEIERFTMRRVEGKGAFNAAAPATPQSRLFETVLKAGIEPEEGLEALERVLAARPGARVVACPVDLAAWDEELSRRPEPARDETVPARAREASRPFVAPRTELERRVAEVFRSLVGAEEIGAEDDFFELGGHSLLLIRAVTRLKQVLEVDLPLAAAFAAPSVAGIARAVESAREVGAAATPVVVPLTRSAFRVKRSELDPLSARR